MTEGVALWRQIAQTLTQEINAGTPPPGGRLPTEAQLSARFGVNRHTVRRGLEELTRAGLVRVEQGRGAFVSEDVLDYAVGARTRFSEWIRRQNKEPSGRVLQLRLLAANPNVAEALKIRPAARVVLFERVGLADERPVSLGLHYFPATRLRGLYNALGESQSISEALRRIGIDDYQRRTTRVSARMPDAREAELLAMPRNRPLLVTESINIDGDGNIIEYGVTAYPTPRVQIVFEPETK
jgi:GntR family phosphonate transport system transcriptional regulator